MDSISVFRWRVCDEIDIISDSFLSVENSSVTSKSLVIKLVNMHYFKCMEIDLFVYINPKEGLCGMHTIQACSSIGQHQMVFYIFHSIKI
jgi:hypothetical protein